MIGGGKVVGTRRRSGAELGEGEGVEFEEERNGVGGRRRSGAELGGRGGVELRREWS